MEIKLEDLFPEKPEFTLNGKTHRLRFITLDDQVWIKNKIGDGTAIANMMKDLDWDKIIPLVYHLLEDKSAFPGGDEEIYNDDGMKETVFVPGYKRLMRSVTGHEASVHLLTALNSAIVKSSPLVEKYVKDEIKKKNLLDKIGQTSSTSSRQSTDGRRKRSQASP